MLDLHFSGSMSSVSVMEYSTAVKEANLILEQLSQKFGIKPQPRLSKEDEANFLMMTISPVGSSSGKAAEILYAGIPDPGKSWSDFQQTKPAIKGALPVATYKLKEKMLDLYKPGAENKEERHRLYRYSYQSLRKLSPSTDLTDTLYIGISLNAKKENLKELLGEIVDREVHGPSNKWLPEKWKLYLIVYDLYTNYTPRPSLREIGMLVCAAFNINIAQEEQNFQNYRNNAIALITSDYQKFMYL